MTIIEPYKAKLQIREFIFIGTLTLLFSVSCIFIYNTNVNLKYGISIKDKASKELESMNAEVRNELLQKTDVRNLGDFIKARGLVQDKNPSYMENKALANR
ncbi:MAG: hypothetical protein AAB674_01620 [Patescibacteria group bacterium]